MTESKVFILSGPLQSGKTTRLIDWLQKRKDVFGILTPVIGGKRFFMDAATREVFPMEAEQSESKVLHVGKYVFSASAFDRAREILREASNQKEGWLLVDEIGPLELKGEGFSNVLKELLSQSGTPGGNLQLVLVVRKTLVDDMVKFFGIERYEELGTGEF